MLIWLDFLLISNCGTGRIGLLFVHFKILGPDYRVFRGLKHFYSLLLSV